MTVNLQTCIVLSSPTILTRSLYLSCTLLCQSGCISVLIFHTKKESFEGRKFGDILTEFGVHFPRGRIPVFCGLRHSSSLRQCGRIKIADELERRENLCVWLCHFCINVYFSMILKTGNTWLLINLCLEKYLKES